MLHAMTMPKVLTPQVWSVALSGFKQDFAIKYPLILTEQIKKLTFNQ